MVEQDRNNLVEKMKIIENQRDDLLRKGRVVESERNDFLRNNKLMEMQKDDLESRCAMLQKTNATLNSRVRKMFFLSCFAWLFFIMMNCFSMSLDSKDFQLAFRATFLDGTQFLNALCALGHTET